MQRTKLFFALQYVLLGFPLQVSADTPDMVINNVWMNGVDRVIESLVLQQGSQRYIECDVLVQLGLKREKLIQHPLQTKFCSVSTETIQSELDGSLQAIKLTVPSDYFIDRQSPAKADPT